MKVDRIVPLLATPGSGAPLERVGDALVAPTGERYSVRDDGKIDFLGLERREDLEEQRDFLDQVKARAKGALGHWYGPLVHLISPVMPRLHLRTLETHANHVIKEKAAGRPLVIQIGSGNDRIDDGIVNIDIFDFPEVDVVADCTSLPFADGTVDGVVSMAVLEHVPNPEDFVKEAARVLKPGGFIVTGVPFMQGFHASPNDYYRWTEKGLEVLHSRWGFVTESVEPIAGPTSSLLWIFQEWLATTLSLGIQPLYFAWWAGLTATLFPVKLADLALIHYPSARKVASFHLYVGMKNAGDSTLRIATLKTERAPWV